VMSSLFAQPRPLVSKQGNRAVILGHTSGLLSCRPVHALASSWHAYSVCSSARPLWLVSPLHRRIVHCRSCISGLIFPDGS